MKALITGVNSLVNKAILEKLTDLGYGITAHYHSENHITAELKQKFPRVRFVQADFGSQAGFERFLKDAGHTAYDVMINAAVCYVEADDLDAQRQWAAWQTTFAVNTTAAGLLMAHAKRLMQKGGVIINISSTYGQPHMGDVRFTMYSASKAALDSLTASFAKKLSPDMRVVGIAPGWVKSAWNKDMSQKDIDIMIAPQLTHRFVEPSEIADLAEHIIRNKSLNATTLVIDGGLGAPII